MSVSSDKVSSSGFYSQTDSYAKSLSVSAYSGHGFSGATANGGSHSHSISWGSSTTTVQPQTVKCFVYMVVSTSIIKSDDVIDIDTITTMIDEKADSDGSNMVNSLSNSAKSYFTRLSLPTTIRTTISIPTSGNTLTAPADGYICCSSDIKLTNNTRYFVFTSLR